MRFIPSVARLTLSALGLGLLLVTGRSSALVPEKPLEGPLTFDSFRQGVTDCFDRRRRPNLAVVDTHLHLRPFGGPIPLPDLLGIVRRAGVLFVGATASVSGCPSTTPARITWIVRGCP